MFQDLKDSSTSQFQNQKLFQNLECLFLKVGFQSCNCFKICCHREQTSGGSLIKWPPKQTSIGHIHGTVAKQTSGG